MINHDIIKIFYQAKFEEKKIKLKFSNLVARTKTTAEFIRIL